MASCQINITGSSGSVLIRYTNGAIINKITADIGDAVYIDDGSTDITYTTLSGDAIAASGCVTINALPFYCILFEWETLGYGCERGDEFTGLLIQGSVTTLANPILLSLSVSKLANEIDILGSSIIVPYAIKQVMSGTGKIKNSLIIKTYGVLSTEIFLILTNNITSYELYIPGVVSGGGCQPTGFSLTNACDDLGV